MHNDNFLEQKLEQRRAEGGFRSLRLPGAGVDFSSNDYLGLVHNKLLHHSELSLSPGSTGSRLLTGNIALAGDLESAMAAFHQSPAALLFNSGYDANIGLISSVAQKGDTILYDFLSHASIRDGVRLSQAQAFSFRHNDVEDLRQRLTSLHSTNHGQIFVITESVFSMDGDIAPLSAISTLCEQFNAHMVVDEAHATGVCGPSGAGVVQDLNLQLQCFARIHTFGKALGCHGAVVLGSERLRNFLINFSRPFIYTTALPETALDMIRQSYSIFPGMDKERDQLKELIRYFQAATTSYQKLVSQTPIQAVIVPGNENVRALSKRLEEAGIDARPILYPTVPKGAERIRIVLHSFNTIAEVAQLAIELQ